MIKTFISGLLEKVYIFLGTLVVLLPVSPLNAPYSLRDSGVFLYTGWRILSGELPYTHVWDHKPPMIFFLNALGLSISPHSKWGVWLLEFVFLFLAAYIGFKLCKQAFGVFAASISTFIWLFALFSILSGGNLTTEYTLLFQFASLFLFWLANSKDKTGYHYLSIGLLGGFTFFFKQTAIGLWIAIGIFLLIDGINKHKIKSNCIKLSLIGLGVLVVSCLLSLYFILNQGFFEFIDAAFYYNFFYSSGTVNLFDRMMNFIIGLDNLTVSTIYQLSIIGIIVFLFKSKRKGLDYRTSSLLLVALINIPIEFLLINLPGFTYPHYFMTMLPGLFIFVGFLLYTIEEWISDYGLLNQSKLIAIILILAAFSLGSIKAYLMTAQKLNEGINEGAIQYLIENTEPDEPVLLWGAETMVNFFSQRKSPTRFVYQIPLFTTGYTSEEIIIDFLDEIIENQPIIIIDTKAEGMVFFQFPITTTEIENKIDYIKSIYVITDKINDWEVYQLSIN